MLKKINMKKGSVVLLVTVFVVAFLVLGVVVAYKYGMLNRRIDDSQTNTPDKTAVQDDLKDRSSEITQLDSDDKIGTIEQDLNKTDINSLDQEVLGVKTESDSL